MGKIDFEKVLTSFPKTNRFGEKVTLVGATKTVPTDVIRAAAKVRLEDIGENKVNEFLDKFDGYPPVNLHFIGHLQTNKVKYIIGKVALIQSCDSLKLAKKISETATQKGIIQDVLVEINIGKEPQKHGFMPDEAFNAVNDISSLNGINVKGLMTVLPAMRSRSALGDLNRALNADLNADRTKTRELCLQMREIYDNIRKQKDNITVLSMGMSSDYEIAVDCGSNMLRIGRLLFGERRYPEKPEI